MGKWTYREIEISTRGPFRHDQGPFPRNGDARPYYVADASGIIAATEADPIARTITASMAGDSEDKAFSRIRRHIDRQLRARG